MVKGIKTINAVKVFFILLLGGCIESPALQYAQPTQSFNQEEETIQTRIEPDSPPDQMFESTTELDLEIHEMVDMGPNDTLNVRLITRSVSWSAVPYTTRTPPRPRINGSFTWTNSTQE